MQSIHRLPMFPNPLTKFHNHRGLLCTVNMTINDAKVTENAIKDTSMIEPRLAGNLPLMTQCCPWRYLLYPSSKIKTLTARNVVPSGLPRWRRFSACLESGATDVLSRNSCVMAMPIEANASDVRSHARNVRSVIEVNGNRSAQPSCSKQTGQHHRPRT